MRLTACGIQCVTQTAWEIFEYPSELNVKYLYFFFFPRAHIKEGRHSRGLFRQHYASCLAHPCVSLRDTSTSGYITSMPREKKNKKIQECRSRQVRVPMSCRREEQFQHRCCCKKRIVSRLTDLKIPQPVAVCPLPPLGGLFKRTLSKIPDSFPAPSASFPRTWEILLCTVSPFWSDSRFGVYMQTILVTLIPLSVISPTILLSDYSVLFTHVPTTATVCNANQQWF